jgi:hypothetical protein
VALNLNPRMRFQATLAIKIKAFSQKALCAPAKF